MALAVENQSSSFGNNVASVTWSHTSSGTNRGIVVGAAAVDYGDDLTITATYAGASLLAKTESFNGNASLHAQQFVKENQASGANDVVVTFTGINVDARVGAVSFNDVDQTTGFSALSTTDTGNSAAATVDVTSATGEIVIDCMVDGEGTAAPTPDGSQTSQWAGTNGVVEGGCSTEAGATTVTMSWSQTSGEWAISALSVIPTGGGGSFVNTAVINCVG